MERLRRGSLVGPLILIGLGVVFLLNNLGALDWNVWEVIFSLWPVLLIAAGLDVLFGRRSGWGALVSLMLIVALLAGAFAILKRRQHCIARVAINVCRPDPTNTDQLISQASRTGVRLDDEGVAGQ